MNYTFEAIGHIHCCLKEKFGIPRQPGLVPHLQAYIEMETAYRRAEAFQALDGFSHIWIVFVFHQCLTNDWSATVRPPRLGGNRRVGVFASRSGFRPNPIGQSVVELNSIEEAKGSLRLNIQGIDLLDGTPVLDIKPYLPYADSHPNAIAGYADQLPRTDGRVVFSRDAERQCARFQDQARPNLRRTIRDLLALDPRPAYADTTQKHTYGMRLWDLNIRFRIEHDQFVVESIGIVG